MSQEISATKRRRQRGTWLLEFALCSVFIVPLFLATVGGGLSLSWSIQTAQVCRDAGHMYMDGIDFTAPRIQKLIGRLAFGMGMASDATGTVKTNGNGVVILSTVMMVGSVECAAAVDPPGACPYMNKLVITDRVIVGNQDLHQTTSALHRPPSSRRRLVTAANYYSASVIVANGTSANALALQAGQFAYASEAYFISPELAGSTGRVRQE